MENLQKEFNHFTVKSSRYLVSFRFCHFFSSQHCLMKFLFFLQGEDDDIDPSMAAASSSQVYHSQISAWRQQGVK
jgi:hypothetical protein